jgi:hypothetical protein
MGISVGLEDRLETKSPRTGCPWAWR